MNILSYHDKRSKVVIEEHTEATVWDPSIAKIFDSVNFRIVNPLIMSGVNMLCKKAWSKWYIKPWQTVLIVERQFITVVQQPAA